MEQDRREAEALRQRLYRPGASTEDVDSYLDVAAPVEPEAQEAQHEHPAQAPAGAARVEPEPDRPTPARRRWPFVLVGAGVVVALAGAAVAVGALAPAPTPSEAAPSAYAGWTSAPRDPGDALVPTVVVDTGRRPHATGRAVPAADQGYLYTIAPHDTVTAIAARFQLCTADVLVALPYGADPTALPAAQRLLLERGAVLPSSTATPGAC